MYETFQNEVIVQEKVKGVFLRLVSESHFRRWKVDTDRVR